MARASATSSVDTRARRLQEVERNIVVKEALVHLKRGAGQARSTSALGAEQGFRDLANTQGDGFVRAMQKHLVGDVSQSCHWPALWASERLQSGCIARREGCSRQHLACPGRFTTPDGCARTGRMGVAGVDKFFGLRKHFLVGGSAA